MLQQVAGTLWSARSDDELISVVEQAQRLSSVLAAVEAGAVAEADLRGLAKDKLHYGSTGDWLTHTGGLRRGEGKRRVVRAHALDRTPHPHPARVGGGGGVGDPGRPDPRRRPRPPVRRAGPGPRGAGDARTRRASLDATELARLGRHLAHVVDPDQEDRRLEAQLEREDRAAHLNRFLAITEDRAGGVRIKGYGSTEDAALLKAALLPLTCPTPTTDDEDGEGRAGSPGPRRPALGRPDRHRPPRPHHRACRRRPTPPHPGCWSPSTTTPSSTSSPPAGSAPPRTAPNSHPRPCAGWPATPRSSPPSSAAAARSSTSAAPDARSPPSSGPPWSCRDRHCTFPGCTRPPVMCHAHHLTHWADGGRHRARQPRAALWAPPPGHP